MPRISRARLAHAAALLLVTTVFLGLERSVRADALTGVPGNDPKDLCLTAPSGPPPVAPNYAIQFAPLPMWARGVLMPPLPACLTPMGKHPLVAKNEKKATSEPLEPPKDSTADTNTAPAPKPAPQPETPAMITVSPFLQWIQANPQAAAAQARQQAGAYPNGANAPTGPVPPANGASGNQPYWLPPLIDSPEITTTPAVVGGSSAIYTRPQR